MAVTGRSQGNKGGRPKQIKSNIAPDKIKDGDMFGSDEEFQIDDRASENSLAKKRKVLVPNAMANIPSRIYLKDLDKWVNETRFLLERNAIQIIERYIEGFTLKQIAEELDIPLYAMYKFTAEPEFKATLDTMKQIAADTNMQYAEDILVNNLETRNMAKAGLVRALSELYFRKAERLSPKEWGVKTSVDVSVEDKSGVDIDTFKDIIQMAMQKKKEREAEADKKKDYEDAVVVNDGETSKEVGFVLDSNDEITLGGE